MPKKNDRQSRGEGASRFEGEEQHGWSPDIDETAQQDNPSAHRSFHPGTYAPEADSSRSASEEEKKASLEGTPVESTGRSGEKRARKTKDAGMHDTGPQGPSRRPSGSRDASGYTGVDPDDPPQDTSGR